MCCIHYLIDSTDMYLIPAQVYSALFGDNPASSPENLGKKSNKQKLITTVIKRRTNMVR